MPEPVAAEVIKALRSVATPARAKTSAWFFKTGPGQYGEGDQFLGVTVPEQRKIARQFRGVSLPEVEKLVTSPWHEARLTGLFILVDDFKHGDQQAVYEFYMSNIGPVAYKLINSKQPASNRFYGINNWDLVDSSAGYIVGPWLDGRPEKLDALTALARSKNLWERRVAMIATFHYIRLGRPEEALVLAEILLSDSHDLIQKAVGWMLREIGRRVDREVLTNFLDQHAAVMPRTALRYAIEHLPDNQRRHYLDARA